MARKILSDVNAVAAVEDVILGHALIILSYRMTQFAKEHPRAAEKLLAMLQAAKEFRGWCSMLPGAPSLTERVQRAAAEYVVTSLESGTMAYPVAPPSPVSSKPSPKAS